MKKTFIISLLLVISLLFSTSAAAVEALDADTVKASTDAMVRLGIMKGDSSGDLMLEKKVSRCEFLTMVIRMLGYEGKIDTSGVDMPFTDIKSDHWAYDNIKAAIKLKLVQGYSDNTVRPDNYVTFAEAQTVILRALGYEKTLVGEWPQSVLDKSSELGLDKQIKLEPGKQLKRSETSVLIYNALPIKFN
jgi:hypothetical protein